MGWSWKQEVTLEEREKRIMMKLETLMKFAKNEREPEARAAVEQAWEGRRNAAEPACDPDSPKRRHQLRPWSIIRPNPTKSDRKIPKKKSDAPYPPQNDGRLSQSSDEKTPMGGTPNFGGHAWYAEPVRSPGFGHQKTHHRNVDGSKIGR